MSEDDSFRGLIGRVRAGDEAAAAELVRRYEPTIRRVVRVRLRDPRLGRLLDSLDVCQSAPGSFFVRAAPGQYELDRPGQLPGLLARTARNKLVNQANQLAARWRDYRRAGGLGEGEAQAPAPGPSPSQLVAGRELLEEARRRLSAEERRLLDLRQQGREWAEIAREPGGQPRRVADAAGAGRGPGGPAARARGGGP
jgi:DNA-directed RNA polymerase specialized sigma24 family protein